MDTYEAIARRASVRRFAPEPVGREQLARVLDAAVRAPNHKLTEPWRFVVLTGGAARRFADLRRSHRAGKFDDPAAPEAAAKIEKTWREHLATPAFIVVLQRLDADVVRREEDFAAVMMAIQNLMLAATADGLGTYLRTGGILANAGVRQLAGAGSDERIVGIVSIGRPAAAPEASRRAPASERTTWLD